MFWIIFGLIVFVSIIAGVIGMYIRDRRFENKSVAETMSDEMWDEIASEREANLLKAKKFKEALDKAKSK